MWTNRSISSLSRGLEEATATSTVGTNFVRRRARTTTIRPHTCSAQLGTPLLADYLEDALSQFGESWKIATPIGFDGRAPL